MLTSDRWPRTDPCSASTLAPASVSLQANCTQPARRLSSGAPRQPRRHSYRQSPTPSSPLGPAPQNPEAGGAPRELRVSDLGGGGLWLLGRAPPQPAAPAELLCSRGCHPLPAACLRSALTGRRAIWAGEKGTRGWPRQVRGRPWKAGVWVCGACRVVGGCVSSMRDL